MSAEQRPDLPAGHARAVRSRTRGMWPAQPYDSADPSDVYHPDYYLATSDSWVEQVLRADLARYHQLAAAAARSAGPAEIDALTARTAAIEGPWLERDDSWARAWRHAHQACHDWIRAPKEMSRRLGALEEELTRGWHTVTAVELRTLRQLRDLSGAGDRKTGRSGTDPAGPIDHDASRIIAAALDPGLLTRRAPDTTGPDTTAGAPRGAESGQVLDDGAGR